ncbi:MAG: polyphenol oxidase family protein [Acidimicrobiia bacterium]
MMVRRELGAASVVFTDRHGGTSPAPFASLNVARHVGDDPGAVVANQRIVAGALDRPDAPWVMPHHVHGTTVLGVTDATRDGEEADGVATQRAGLLLAAIGADCAPIAIANDTACAAIHAGWRGAVHGVVAAGVAVVRALGTGPVRAIVGPCVCVAHYEFGADLLERLTEECGPEVAGRTAAGAPAFDLRATVVAQFRRVDVLDVEVLDVCTVESADHYSYRRDGITGRQAVVVVKRE